MTVTREDNAMTALLFQPLAALLLRLWARASGPDDERGDVPGWVLITLMTAGLVTVLWVIAGERLVDLFNDALSGVSGPGDN